MDALRPGHAHRSSSDRLLNNYLDSQKHLSTSLLTLLSHSHTSTSSLLAYVTSSPGVVQPVRRSVRHAAFEGPLSNQLVNDPQNHNAHGEETQGWSAYISCLDAFRKDLKQIHLLEEEMSRVKRDREILVTRLIKTTKKRPTKSDLSAIANDYRSNMSSRASVSSFNSNVSSASKEGKRAGKLADAQAELLGCEEHLRSLEVRIEHERNVVMTRGLEDRFRAMEAVGRMWVSQAQKGLDDLEKVHELSPDAYELDSNPSIAPSQSASQIAYEDSHRGVPFPRHPLHGAGSITGSIVEENEDSSDDDAGNLVVHENRPASRASTAQPRGVTKPSPLGVPSVNSRARPLSSASLARHAGSDSDLPRQGGRRAASDVGAMGYRPPTGRSPLRRTFSHDNARAGSDRSSVRSAGGPKKKRGFFASIKKFFKGPEGRSGRTSPPYGSGNKSGWSTRTDSNIKRSSSMFGGRRGGDDSSSDEDTGNFVSVSNNRGDNTFSVDNVGKVGRPASRASTKRNSGPVASGLIPAPRGMKREGSQSTITRVPRSGAATPTQGTITRSNTMKSSVSAASKGTAGKRIRPNGSISRSASTSTKAAEGRTIMSLIDDKGPSMPEVPKAPKSQVTPQMELPKAPGSSLVQAKATQQPTLTRSASKKSQSGETARSNTPLPPSRTLQPPLKSALRPTSPSPAQDALPPPIELPSKPLYSIAAPGPVRLPDEVPPTFKMPTAAPKEKIATVPPPNATRTSYHSVAPSDGNSVYESAMEDGDAPHADESSDDEGGMDQYKVVDNERVKRLGINIGAPHERVSNDQRLNQDDESVTSTDTATHNGPLPQAPAQVPGNVSTTDSVSRRKSVRVVAPESPGPNSPVNPTHTTHTTHVNENREASPDTAYEKEQWNTRIGRMREDTSDESDHDDDYLAARKGLIKNNGQWDGVKKSKRKSGTGSVKSSASVKSSGTLKKKSAA